MQNIILVGFMGCGKSTLGKKIAKKLNIPFIDSDHEIERMEGISISEIFASKGEEYFRNLEHDFLVNLLNTASSTSEKFVLSCGGGMPCFHENMQLLNQIGTTFYLKLSVQELAKRLTLAKSVRPLVKDKSAEELHSFIDDKLNERKGFYENANFILIGKEQNPTSILQKLA
ncbi:MAG: shikimate kinase [Flavobacteriia bacterium]|jgi:shikimate kinase